MAAPGVWGRGAGEGIGLSGHKNEYRKGVCIGNWVEEQFGREAGGGNDSLKQFMLKTEASQLGSTSRDESRGKRVEPNMGVPAPMLFSHGTEFGCAAAAAATRSLPPVPTLSISSPSS